MSDLDVIPIPGHAGMFARRCAVEAWTRAGSPRIRSAGRLYGEQKYLYDGWIARLPDFYPADDPDDTSQMLAHVRFVAFDIWDDYATWRPRMLAAGFLPLESEAWHFYLPDPWQYGLVHELPPVDTERKDDPDMPRIIERARTGVTYSIAPAFLKAHEDGAERAADETLYGTSIKLEEDAFRRTLKNHGFHQVVGSWNDPSWGDRLPKPGDGFIEPVGTKSVAR